MSSRSPRRRAALPPVETEPADESSLPVAISKALRSPSAHPNTELWITEGEKSRSPRRRAALPPTRTPSCGSRRARSRDLQGAAQPFRPSMPASSSSAFPRRDLQGAAQPFRPRRLSGGRPGLQDVAISKAPRSPSRAGAEGGGLEYTVVAFSKAPRSPSAYPLDAGRAAAGRDLQGAAQPFRQAQCEVAQERDLGRDLQGAAQPFRRHPSLATSVDELLSRSPRRRAALPPSLSARRTSMTATCRDLQGAAQPFRLAPSC